MTAAQIGYTGLKRRPHLFHVLKRLPSVLGKPAAFVDIV
jgi:hypothetical protein